jgi:hypothetical protein
MSRHMSEYRSMTESRKPPNDEVLRNVRAVAPSSISKRPAIKISNPALFQYPAMIAAAAKRLISKPVNVSAVGCIRSKMVFFISHERGLSNSCPSIELIISVLKQTLLTKRNPLNTKGRECVHLLPFFIAFKKFVKNKNR